MQKVVFLFIIVAFLLSSVRVVRAEPFVESGPITIRTDGSIDPHTAPISTLDNVTYTLSDDIFNESIVVERDNIVVDGAFHIVEGTGSGNGITLSGRTNVTIKNMTIKAFFLGIVLGSSSYNTLSGNNITANDFIGIWLGSSSNNSISGNNMTASTNGDGIVLYSSSNNTLSGNNVTANNFYGIYLYSSSDNNVLSGNNIANNLDGIRLYSSSDNNTLSGNNVTANNNYGITLSFSSNNSIFRNNFVNNTNQVYTDGLANAWNNGFEGNYWSDYNGTDSNHDGIGDTPYVIDANNIDHHPLMTQYIIPEFPTFLILPLFFGATLLAVIVYKRKHPQNTVT